PTPTPTPGLTATAGVNVTSGAAPLTVTFSATASGGTTPYSYSWAFGDGGTSTAQNPGYSYNTAGTYVAQLIVTDAKGKQALSSVTIVVRPAIVVTVSGSPATGPAPLAVNFTGGATGGDSGPYTYSWDFGDGSTGTGAGTSHTYTSGGTYTATLTVTDGLGDSGSAIIGISPLGAGLAASPTSGNFNLNVNFSATPVGGSGTYTSYNWTFGDGGTATTTIAATSHTYMAAGTYNATVQVVDSTPSSVTSAAVAITVTTPPLTATASGAPTTGLAPVTVNFTGTAGGGTPGYTYAWNFGDGSAPVTGLTSPTTSYTYNLPGSYTATMTITDTTAPVQTATATVNITSNAPVPGIGSVSPPFGPETGGTSVTITGTYFENATAVKFGAKLATFSAPTCDGLGNCTIVATSPSSAAGTVNVIVITPGGTSPASNDQFTYDPAWFSSTATGPSGREGAAMANDGTEVVLFGGSNGLTDLSDTWIWTGSAWTSSTATGPSARQGAAIAYDSSHGSVVMFGGDCTLLVLNCDLNDTWTWSSTTKTWTAGQANNSAPGGNQPSQRAGAMMVFDANRGQVILFGGYTQGLLGTTYYNDLWVYNFNASKWTQVLASNCASTTQPACRAYGSMGRDGSGQIVLFGGANATSTLGDTWTLSTSTWTLYTLSSPPARQQAALGFLNKPGGGTAVSLVLFGGRNGSTVLGDTWTWSGGRWLQIYGAGAGSPSARYDASAATDTSNGVVIFGGNSGSALDSDTWVIK
ncbi:MAG TPA: PKD domain-containing protein, partial [Candidatus Dormibacteraeota bacterium]